MPDLEEGQKFERYRVIRLLGQGVAGVSYEAEDMMLHRQVTLKLIHPWSRLPDSARRQFFRDMQSISLFAHPHQAATLDYGEVDGQLYIVRQFVPAGSLLNSDGRAWFAPPLAVRAAVTYMHQIAQALYDIHRYGHVHGSLTLSNLLVTRCVDHDREPEAVPFLLSDVGMAHFVRRFGHPQIARLPITSAPEQARGRVAPASDQYALAAILYFWLAGRLPFFGSPNEIEQAKRAAIFPVLTTQNPQVTFEQEGIIRRALSAYPEERYPTILAFAEALRASLAHTPSRPTPTRQAQPVQPTQPTISQPVASTTEPLEVSITLPPTTGPETPLSGTKQPIENVPLSGTFLIDQQTLNYLTTLTTEEDASPPEPSRAESAKQQTNAEPVSGTFVLDQETLRMLTILAKQDSPAEEPEKPTAPEPLPQIEPDLPLPSPETTPLPQPVSVPEPEPALLQEPEQEPVVIPPPAPDIAQPLPQPSERLPLPPGIVRPLETPTPDARPQQKPASRPEMPTGSSQQTANSRSTDALPPLMEQAVVLPQLTITSPYTTNVQEFTLTRKKTTLGRAGSNDILLDKDTLTSRRHAYIRHEGEQYIIYDDDSIHGVIVNGHKLTSGAGHALSDGDQICIGEYDLTFHMKVVQYVSQEVHIPGAHIIP